MPDGQKDGANTAEDAAQSPDKLETDLKSLLVKLRKSRAALDAYQSSNRGVPDEARTSGDLHQTSEVEGETKRDEVLQGISSPEEPIETAGEMDVQDSRPEVGQPSAEVDGLLSDEMAKRGDEASEKAAAESDGGPPGAGVAGGTAESGDVVDIEDAEAIDAGGPVTSAGLENAGAPDNEVAARYSRQPEGDTVTVVESGDSENEPGSPEKSAKDIGDGHRGPATIYSQTNRPGRTQGTVPVNANDRNGLRKRRVHSSGNGLVNGGGSGRAHRRRLTNDTGLSNGIDPVKSSRTSPVNGAREAGDNGRGMITFKAAFNRIWYVVLALGIVGIAVGFYWDPLNGRLLEFSAIGPMQIGVVVGSFVFCILGIVFLIAPWEKDAGPRPRLSGGRHGSQPEIAEKASSEEE